MSVLNLSVPLLKYPPLLLRTALSNHITRSVVILLLIHSLRGADRRKASSDVDLLGDSLLLTDRYTLLQRLTTGGGVSGDGGVVAHPLAFKTTREGTSPWLGRRIMMLVSYVEDDQ